MKKNTVCHYGKILALLFVICGCQTQETKILESDDGLEARVFSHVNYKKKVDLKRAVIVDVRSRFDFEMSRLPRSFNAYWKDWDLSGYTGRRLKEKVKELQRLLSLQGIDSLTQVVILGNGLKGQGEEFLLATTLISLGIEKVSFIQLTQAKKAVMSKKVPPAANLPYWSKPIKYNFNCSYKKRRAKNLKSKADIFISSRASGALRPGQVFSKNLQVKERSYPKNRNLQIYSGKSLWAYGLALHFKYQGRKPCVL